jgi:predicted DNA-binding protein (MmcQ/YjbR family)
MPRETKIEHVHDLIRESHLLVAASLTKAKQAELGLESR